MAKRKKRREKYQTGTDTPTFQRMPCSHRIMPHCTMLNPACSPLPPEKEETRTAAERERKRKSVRRAAARRYNAVKRQTPWSSQRRRGRACCMKGRVSWPSLRLLPVAWPRYTVLPTATGHPAAGLCGCRRGCYCVWVPTRQCPPPPPAGLAHRPTCSPCPPSCGRRHCPTG